MTFDAISDGGSVILDAAKAVGGNDEGLRPKALMLVALAGCTAMDVASLFAKMRAEPEGFQVKVEAELTDKHPKYYHTVTVHYYFSGKDLKKDKLEKAVNLSVERYCGVNEMFRRFADVSIKIHYNED